MATSVAHVDLRCVGNPGMSRATKNVYRSVNTARTDISLGDASSGNQDFGIQSELAASPSGNLAVTSFSSGDWIYLHDKAGGNWATPVNLADGGGGWNDVVYSSNQTAWVVYGPVDFTGAGQLRATHDGDRHWKKTAL